MEEKEKAVLSSALLFLDQQLTNQNEVLQLLTKQAEILGYVSKAENLYDSIKEREQIVPTAIGYDIAIPHGKTEAVLYPFIAFLRTKSPFRWSSESEEMVQLIFMIGVPKTSEGTLHLKFISQLSKKLLNDEFREKLLIETNKKNIYAQLNSIEL